MNRINTSVGIGTPGPEDKGGPWNSGPFSGRARAQVFSVR